MPSFLERCQEVIEAYPRIAAELFYIRSETQGFIKLKANRVQEHYHADRVARGFTAHDEILKARKHGISTWKELEGLALALFVDGFSGLVMADEKEKATRLFNIVLWAYQRLPEDLRQARKLDTDRRDAIAIGGSTLYVVTAQARAPVRSDTIHWAHLTEVAYYPDWDRVMSGVIEAMAEAGKSAHLCRESTPAGRNEFYEACRAARDGLSKSKLYFYEWWWSDKYSLPLEPGEVIIPTEEEKNIIAIAAKNGFKIRPEQLKWRRWKNLPTELGARDEMEEAVFAQEYVEDFETCFLVGGRPIFKPAMLKLIAQQAEAAWPIERKHLPGGEFYVWKEAGKFPHVIGVDVAEGKLGNDWSVISVWESAPERFTTVARMKIHCSPEDLAHHVIDVAQRYRNPVVCVERNAAGLLTIFRLQQLGYSNFYYMPDADGNPTDHIGWHTSARSKPMMLAQFKQMVDSGEAVIYDPELVEQMGNIQYDDLGKIVTPKNRHDDIFMAACMAAVAREQAGYSLSSGFSVASYA